MGFVLVSVSCLSPLYSPGWPGTGYVDQAHFEFIEIFLFLPLSAEIKGAHHNDHLMCVCLMSVIHQVSFGLLTKLTFVLSLELETNTWVQAISIHIQCPVHLLLFQVLMQDPYCLHLGMDDLCAF